MKKLSILLSLAIALICLSAGAVESGIQDIQSSGEAALEFSESGTLEGLSRVPDSMLS